MINKSSPRKDNTTSIKRTMKTVKNVYTMDSSMKNCNTDVSTLRSSTAHKFSISSLTLARASWLTDLIVVRKPAEIGR